MTMRLSATRLNSFLSCAHHAALWLDGVSPPAVQDASLDLVREKGFDHEIATLKALEAVCGAAVTIPDSLDLPTRAAETQAAIRQGAPLIYQGVFTNDRWVGVPDFLLRVSAGEGGWRYQPQDAKLSRKAKAEHVLQLGLYAALLAESVSIPVESGVIHVGAGEPERFDLKRTQHITGRLMRRFEAFADVDRRDTRPIKSSACLRCSFHPRCEAEWRSADSPTFIAGIRGDQIIRLEASGVKTLTSLSACDPASPIGGVGQDSFAKLVRQARLQRAGAERGKPLIELLPTEPGRGFALLPPPEPGDLFFDMEGDPHYPEGLEYLFGLWGPLAVGGADAFHPIWAHDRGAEKAAFEKLMRLFTAHLRRYPTAHIFHYAPYETAALKRLAMRHATMEAELDQLLRQKRFVDLYRVARQAIRASTEGYSLKDLETIYWGGRSGAVTNASDSIVEYERWREIGEPAILVDIGRYNEDDCVSTARLRDWLESLRPAGAVYGRAAPEPERDADDQERAATREAFEQERRLLASAVRAARGVSDSTRDLIAELLWFHQRAQKPQWWALFDRQTWSDEELFDDLESLGCLELDPRAPVFADKKSLVATYRFHAQETKLKEGAAVKIALTLESAGTIAELAVESGRIILRRGLKAGEFPSHCSLVPGGLINQRVLIDAVLAFARRTSADEAEDDRALIGVLERAPPRLRNHKAGTPILRAGAELLDGAVDAVIRLDNSHLVIQGPPGTGKTFTLSHAIIALLKAGKRVAVSSNSHKAIHNLLEAIEERAAECGFAFLGAKKASKGDPETVFSGRRISPAYSSDDILPANTLVGGTAFHFARPDQLRAFDYLIVDEAGQVALGNLVAMAGCARNIVLAGDQMQLPQPVQGVHPGDSGLSCLDYLMQGHATVPRELGILLNVSWRMHPALCGFVSQAFYDGRLTAHPKNAERRIVLQSGAHPALRSFGISVAEVAHVGCTQSSREEAEAVAEIVQSLLKQSVRGTDGLVRPVALTDILVVAPFNAQVNLLRRHLPPGARVGTVDKFQGQEAAVAIVSMATSHGADAPRGTEFLFSPNRLNVAISRAQCLAIIVCGGELLALSPGSIADLERLDPFARAERTSRSPQVRFTAKSAIPEDSFEFTPPNREIKLE